MKKKSSGASSKKRTSKSQQLKKFKLTPTIIIIAVLELVILLGAISYAWFALASHKEVNSGEITVSPDSGLKIDFAHTDNTDHINIWNYLDSDFAFEPATSLDGRNIFFPTTGTFNETATNDMTFREGTVNDVNSKYVAIDFTLTNTGENPVQVYLKNNSYFKINDNSITGRALRIAFYQNDNMTGKVNSSQLSYDPTITGASVVYFNDNLGWAKNGKTPHAYIWNDSASPKTYIKAWPGTPMKKISGDQYCIIFDNDTEGYDHIVFHDGTAQTKDEAAEKQTIDLNLQNCKIYTPTTVATSGKYECEVHAYSDYVSNSGYAVIAPGISTGFQRPYSPVMTMNNDSGDPSIIVPAFASSIDDYFNGTNGTLFSLSAGQTKYLTMIMWLEGTDADCIDTMYSSKNIDLFLEFAKSDDQSDKHTYIFHDATKETWIDDEIDDNGVKFHPVVQLYDENLKRGYLMTQNPSDSTLWSVDAPTDIAGHNLQFRRVNPMDEDEVWNYWNAGRNLTEQIGGAFHFTALADGAPLHYYDSDKTTVLSNTRSCGGLWGNYSTTKILTVYDGTDGHFIKNSDDSGTTGCMTVTYTLGGQTIEYKASSSGNAYMFVVPQTVMDYTNASRPSVEFRRYYNFISTYAINAQDAALSAGVITGKNPKITYHRKWEPGQVKGAYYCISQNDYGTYEDHKYNYWGSDLLIIQVPSTMTDYYDSTKNWVQVKYFNWDDQNSATLESSGHFYSYCFNDGNFNGNYSNSFASVVPNSTAYNMYRVQAGGKTSHSTINHQTAPISAGQYSHDYSKWYANTSTWFNYSSLSTSARIKTTQVSSACDSSGSITLYDNRLLHGNIISLKDTYTYIFLQLRNNYDNPYVHLFNDSGGSNPYEYMSYMLYEGDYKFWYYCVKFSDYAKYQFKNSGGNNYYPSGSGNYLKVSDAPSNVYKVGSSFQYEAKWNATSFSTISNNGWSSADNTSYGIYNDNVWNYSGDSRPTS